MLKSLKCQVTGHRVNRLRVWHDGRNYRTKCDKCGTPLIRERTGWRAFDFVKDAAEERQPHPVTGEIA